MLSEGLFSLHIP